MRAKEGKGYGIDICFEEQLRRKQHADALHASIDRLGLKLVFTDTGYKVVYKRDPPTPLVNEDELPAYKEREEPPSYAQIYPNNFVQPVLKCKPFSNY